MNISVSAWPAYTEGNISVSKRVKYFSLKEYIFWSWNIRSNTHEGELNSLINPIISETVNWNSFATTSLFSFLDSSPYINWCTPKFPSALLVAPAKNMNEHAEAQSPSSSIPCFGMYVWRPLSWIIPAICKPSNTDPPGLESTIKSTSWFRNALRNSKLSFCSMSSKKNYALGIFSKCMKLPNKLRRVSFLKSFFSLGSTSIKVEGWLSVSVVVFGSGSSTGAYFGFSFKANTVLIRFCTFADFLRSAPFRFCLLYAARAPAIPLPYRPPMDAL